VDYPGCPDLRNWCSETEQFAQPVLPGNPQLEGNFACIYLKEDMETEADEEDYVMSLDPCRTEVLPIRPIIVSMSCNSL